MQHTTLFVVYDRRIDMCTISRGGEKKKKHMFKEQKFSLLQDENMMQISSILLFSIRSRPDKMRFLIKGSCICMIRP